MSVQTIALIESQRQYIFLSRIFCRVLFPHACLDSFYMYYTHIFIFINLKQEWVQKRIQNMWMGTPFANEMMFWNLPLITFALSCVALWFIHSDGWSQVMRMRCNYNLWNEWDRATSERVERRMKMGKRRRRIELERMNGTRTWWWRRNNMMKKKKKRNSQLGQLVNISYKRILIKLIKTTVLNIVYVIGARGCFTHTYTIYVDTNWSSNSNNAAIIKWNTHTCMCMCLDVCSLRCRTLFAKV